MQPEPDLVYQAFEAICETRTLTKAGYVRFRNFLLYGERGLAGNKTLVNIFQDTLTLEYGEYPLSRYSIEWQPDDRHLLRVGNPRLYDHPYQSPQLPLWEPGEVEWFVIIRNSSPLRRRKRRGRLVLIQPPLWPMKRLANSICWGGARDTHKGEDMPTEEQEKFIQTYCG